MLQLSRGPVGHFFHRRQGGVCHPASHLVGDAGAAPDEARAMQPWWEEEEEGEVGVCDKPFSARFKFESTQMGSGLGIWLTGAPLCGPDQLTVPLRVAKGVAKNQTQSVGL